MRDEVRASRREGMGRRRCNRCAGGGSDSRLGRQGTRGAHVEHTNHARDAGRVDAERLVERNRVLLGQMQGIRSGAKMWGTGGGRAWGW